MGSMVCEVQNCMNCAREQAAVRYAWRLIVNGEVKEFREEYEEYMKYSQWGPCHEFLRLVEAALYWTLTTPEAIQFLWPTTEQLHAAANRLEVEE